jgi:NAD+ synthase (glutamine-hydrolysing)
MKPTLIRLGAAVLNQTPLDWDGNAARIAACMAEARTEGVSVLCLPEMCITGYGCEDAFLSRGVHETALATLQALAPQTHGLVVTLGLPCFHQNAVFNTVCVVADGRILGFVAKRHLARDGVHYEPRWFQPWRVGARSEMTVGGQTFAMGDLHFALGGVRIGVEICEDAWVAERPAAGLASAGVDIILNASASHFALGKHQVRERLVTGSSRAFGVTYVYANLLGNEAGRIIYDGGALIASQGELVARGPRFSFADHHLVSAVIDIEALRADRARAGGADPSSAPATQNEIPTTFSFPTLAPTSISKTPPLKQDSKEDEFTRAVALGLFDYVRKSHAQGVVISLSGGCDSSAVACLSALMVHLCVRELGFEGFRTRFGHIGALRNTTGEREAIARLVTCVYQSTRNSSEATRGAARQVTVALGARFLELDVDGVVAEYTAMVERATGHEATWDAHDVALQNIQARARGPGVWMIANLQKALLLATSNRSEAAVGYTTMDGDTCGGLSPLAGIDKAFLRHYLRWLETEDPLLLGPGVQAALRAVSDQEPTAELRPPAAHQTDEADLMPYDVLDAIERAAIRDKQMPIEVYARMLGLFPAAPRTQLVHWIERFFRLWCQNQWKRERYAPCFHLDDENLDPKTWCRFPILSSGFERELAELRAFVPR